MKIIDGKTYDVVVCGCGSAGFCAAVQAARAGMKTAVIEKYGMPGGIMTVMGNNDVAQFYAHKKQVISGIGWEFILRLAEQGFADIPDMTVDAPHWKYGVHVNIVAAAHLIDNMLTEAGVDIYYNQPAVEVEVNNSAKENLKVVDSVIISTKSGLKRITGKMFIDCTGDGDICAWAGADYECGDEITGALQPGTIRYYFDIGFQNNCDTKSYKYITEKLKEAYNNGTLLYPDTMNRDFETLINANGNNVNHISGYNGADSDSKTICDIEGRASVYRLMKSIHNITKHPGIVSIAPEVGMRETRRIICDTYITVDEYISAYEYPDSICNSFYPIDLHRDGMEKIYQIFLEEGKVPKIPLSALIVKGFDNLYVAGRCASGDRLAQSAFRVKASCMAMGQAAGAAAAVAVKENNASSRGCCLDHIKEILRKDGAIVP